VKRSVFARKHTAVCISILSFVVLLVALPLFGSAIAVTIQLQNDNDAASGYTSNARSCYVAGSVLEAAAHQYPLRVLSVDFSLYQFTGADPSAQVRAVVYSIGADGAPDVLLARSDPVEITTFYPDWVSISFTHTLLYVPHAGSFLVGLEYVDGTDGTTPSFLMDSSTSIPANRNFYSSTCGDSWTEHYDWWVDPSNAGYNMIRATVETNASLPAGYIDRGAFGGIGKQHALARTTDGRVHLVYEDQKGEHLYHTWSSDDGQNWQPFPPSIVAASEKLEMALASGLTETLHMIQGPWDGQEAYYQRYDGNDWESPAQVGDWAYGRNVAVDSQGHVHVVWSNNNIWYTRFDGVTWSSPTAIASGAWHPAIAVGPGDGLHVAYNDNLYCCDNTGVEVRYIHSSDGGSTWSEPENVSQDTVWSGGASMAVTPDGAVHLTYIARSSVIEGGLYYRQGQSGQWSAPQIISSGNAGVQTGSTGWDSAAMMADAENNVFVVFRYMNTGGHWDICLRIRDWQGWSPVMNLTNNAEFDSEKPNAVYGIVPSERGLDVAWNTAGNVIYRYIPRHQLPINPTPTPPPTATPSPGDYYVRVVDENGTSVDGARVYHNGVLVTDGDGQPILTSYGGVLNFPYLQPGDTLAALALQDQAPTARDAHDGDPDPRYPNQDWAYRVYLTSMDVDGAGSVSTYVVPDPSAGEHRLVVKRTNPLVLYNMLVSVEWDATVTYTNQISQALVSASDYLYDITDGQMAFGQAAIYDNGAHWADADIQVSTKNTVRPHAYVGGITSEDTSHVIRVGRYWNGYTGNQGPWNEPDGYRTLGHEFGHYGLFLYDEYFTYVFDAYGNLVKEVPTYCTGPENRNPATDATNASAMDHQYTSSELSMRGVTGLWSGLCESTAQWQLNGESPWETLTRIYTDTAASPRWQFTTPADRGSVLAGPAGLSRVLSGLPYVQVTQQGASTPPRRLTVYHPSGGGYWGAIVALYKQDGRVIGQGFTDSNGQLDVYGAVEGDTLRAASFDGGLSGSTAIGTEVVLNLPLAPIVSMDAMASSGSIPHMQVRAEPSLDPGQIDLLVSLAGFGPSADPVLVVTEPGGEVGYAPTLSYSPGAGTYEGGISFSATERGLGYVRAVGEVGGARVRLQSTYSLQRVGNERSQDIHSTDGNLSLHLDASSLPGSEAYFVIVPPGAVPGPLPEGLVLIGDLYDVTASGALVTLDKPAILKLHYDQALVNTESAPEGLGIYRWDPVSETWQAVAGTLDEEQKAIVAPVTTLGAYTLLAPPGPWMGSRQDQVFLPLVLADSVLDTKGLPGSRYKRPYP